MYKKLGGDTARTADPNWPKGYSIPYDMTCSAYVTRGGVGWAGDHCSGDWQGIQSTGKQGMVFVLCITTLHDGSLFHPGGLNIIPFPDGKWSCHSLFCFIVILFYFNY